MWRRLVVGHAAVAATVPNGAGAHQRLPSAALWLRVQSSSQRSCLQRLCVLPGIQRARIKDARQHAAAVLEGSMLLLSKVHHIARAPPSLW